MAIKALLFDLWGTLLYIPDPDDTGSARRALVERVTAGLASVGHGYRDESVVEALTAFSGEHRAMHAAGRDISQPERIERILELIERGLAARLSRAAWLVVEDAIGGGRLVNPPLVAPDGAAVLEAARGRGLGTGLVSITGLTPGYVLRAVLAGHGLLRYFQAITFSDEARLAKPTPDVFRCTLEVLGVEPREAAFVGDSPEADIAGPQALGMVAVQIGDREQDGVQPEARIATLSELLPALEELGLLD